MNPDLVAIVCKWWDEGREWAPGVTSAVLADWLDDHPEEWKYPIDHDFVAWMRHGSRYGPTGQPTVLVGAEREWLNEQANVHHVSVATSAAPEIRTMLQDFALRLTGQHGLIWSDVARDAFVLIGAAECNLFARTRELREYLMQLPARHDFAAPVPLSIFGLPNTLYGWRLVLNDVQPAGQIDCVCGDHIVTARVY